MDTHLTEPNNRIALPQASHFVEQQNAAGLPDSLDIAPEGVAIIADNNKRSLIPLVDTVIPNTKMLIEETLQQPGVLASEVNPQQVSTQAKRELYGKDVIDNGVKDGDALITESQKATVDTANVDDTEDTRTQTLHEVAPSETLSDSQDYAQEFVKEQHSDTIIDQDSIETPDDEYAQHHRAAYGNGNGGARNFVRTRFFYKEAALEPINTQSPYEDTAGTDNGNHVNDAKIAIDDFAISATPDSQWGDDHLDAQLNLTLNLDLTGGQSTPINTASQYLAWWQLESSRQR